MSVSSHGNRAENPAGIPFGMHTFGIPPIFAVPPQGMLSGVHPLYYMNQPQTVTIGGTKGAFKLFHGTTAEDIDEWLEEYEQWIEQNERTAAARPSRCR